MVEKMERSELPHQPTEIGSYWDPQAREDSYKHFVKDLKLVHQEMKRISREQANASGKRMHLTLLEEKGEAVPPTSEGESLWAHGA